MAYQFPPDVDQLLKERMATGGYTSEDDVLRDALRALEEMTYFRPRPNAAKLSFEQLRSEVRRGLDQLDRGEGRDADEVFDELLRDLPGPDRA
jgi:Arc/MetJ-type ribon-helix-helix transcriptional regulator